MWTKTGTKLTVFPVPNGESWSKQRADSLSLALIAPAQGSALSWVVINDKAGRLFHVFGQHMVVFNTVLFEV